MAFTTSKPIAKSHKIPTFSAEHPPVAHCQDGDTVIFETNDCFDGAVSPDGVRDWEGKAQAAIRALLEDGCDFCYIHVEAPDEMGHQGLVEEKVASIEYLDSRIIGPLKKALEEAGEDFRMLVLPDHPTPIRCRTHTSDPVPYVLYDSTCQKETGMTFNEENADKTGNYQADGYRLIDKMIKTGGLCYV